MNNKNKNGNSYLQIRQAEIIWNKKARFSNSVGSGESTSNNNAFDNYDIFPESIGSEAYPISLQSIPSI